MIRNQDWKYIWNTTDVDELYFLKEDPYELVNRIYEPSLSNIVIDLRDKLYWQLYYEGDGLVESEWIKYQLLKGKIL
jgi:hypothetical protein